MHIPLKFLFSTDCSQSGPIQRNDGLYPDALKELAHMVLCAKNGVFIGTY
jgi:hypothetical protein